ncbi:MAG: GreA/GreB family elongation factor [Mucilaginibacter polytrichastri]|nr:GreA/GreB family elongation factor [Mucilaginibacter polytrichastri]
MTDQEILAVKEALYNYCQAQVNNRIREAEDAMASARSTSEGETKSSAGDKYETTREMMQQEIARNEAQLLASGKLRYALQQIKTDFVNDTVQEGSLVFTEQGNFYIAISLGETEALGKKYFSISPASPLGAKMITKKAGETVAFNGKSYKITAVY